MPAETSTVDTQAASMSGTSVPAPQRTLEEGEIEIIRAALDAASGNISVAAKRLGISRNTIYRKMRWNQS
jgi:transcriptional regulator of acetoin/glycerol metabolism